MMDHLLLDTATHELTLVLSVNPRNDGSMLGFLNSSVELVALSTFSDGCMTQCCKLLNGKRILGKPTFSVGKKYQTSQFYDAHVPLTTQNAVLVAKVHGGQTMSRIDMLYPWDLLRALQEHAQAPDYACRLCTWMKLATRVAIAEQRLFGDAEAAQAVRCHGLWLLMYPSHCHSNLRPSLALSMASLRLS